MRRFTSTYADLGWLVPDALAYYPSASALYYDQVAQIEMPNWTRGRVALLGDACQAVSLLAGQGASLAVAAAYVLGTELRRTPTVPEALARYRSRLAPVVAEKQAAGRRAAEWFLPTSPSRLALRRVTHLRAMRLPGLDHLIGRRLVAGSGIPDRSTRSRPLRCPDLATALPDQTAAGSASTWAKTAVRNPNRVAVAITNRTLSVLRSGQPTATRNATGAARAATIQLRLEGRVTACKYPTGGDRSGKAQEETDLMQGTVPAHCWRTGRSTRRETGARVGGENSGDDQPDTGCADEQWTQDNAATGSQCCPANRRRRSHTRSRIPRSWRSGSIPVNRGSAS